MDQPHSPAPHPPYTEEQLCRFREEFLPQATRWRIHDRWVTGLSWAAGLLLLFTLLFCPLARVTTTAYVEILVAAVVLSWLHLRTPKLSCPACRNLIDVNQPVPLCPQCGLGVGVKEGWFSELSCSRCRARLIRARREGRLYRVRHCTHCGVLLDVKGL
jgi:hypothetical protein